MTARPSVAGDALRVRVSNRFGDRELKLSRVTVAQPARGVALVPGTARDARFGGVRALTIPAGKDAISDAVDIAVDPDRDVTISIGIVSSGRLTWHVAGPLASYATSSGTGDRTTETSGASFRRGVGSYVLLTGIQVRATAPTPAIVALGDSITDAGSATPENSWLGVLGIRLRQAGRPHAVVDAGIACNDLTITSRLGGLRAGDRFKADVLNRVGTSHVIIFEGTNDVFGGVAPQKVIDALAAIAVRAHAAGLRVIGATLIPKRDSPSPAREDARQTVNAWIRTTKVFDGVIDFDAAVRSADHPDRIQPEYAGDAIHPNPDGQAAMGNAINLNLFARPRSS